MAEEYTREEYIAKFGYDPEPLAMPTAPHDDKPGTFANLTRNMLTGALSIPTDIIALPQFATAGVGALFGDKKFLEEFFERTHATGASEKITQHLKERIAELAQAYPDVTEQEAKQYLDDYSKSKKFEDFSNSMLTFGPRVTNAWKDVLRRAMGDERPDSKRDWVDAAQEIIGGSVVGGPTGWASKAGALASKSATAAAVVGSPIARGALRTAEALTPLTIPYSGTNVAINAGVGVALDQGIRALQGKGTVFSTGSDNNQSGMVELAGVAAVLGATAAFVGG